MKILIINCTSERSNYAYYTKGGDAVLFGTVYALRHYFPEASLVTLMQCPEDCSRELNLTVIQQKSINKLRPFWIIDILRSSIDLLRAALWSVSYKLFHIDSKFLVSMGKLCHYRDADVIIHLGGDLYSDDKGLTTVVEHSKEILMGIMLRKPVAIYAESLGPFRGKLSSWLARLTLNRVSLITVRENISKENILRIKVVRPSIYVTADPAFLLEPESPERVKTMLCKLGYDGTGPLIGLIISEDIYAKGHIRSYNRAKFIYSIGQYILPERLLSFALNSRIGQKNRLKVIDSIAEVGASISNCLIEQLNATVILIPNATNPVFDIDEINRRIFKLTKNKSRIRVIEFAACSAREIKGLIGQCDLFIGSKMHACIAAWSQGVPAIAIASSHKYYGVALPIGQERYVCESVTMREIFDKIQEAYNRRQEIREELQSKLPTMRQLAMLNAELIRKFVSLS